MLFYSVLLSTEGHEYNEVVVCLSFFSSVFFLVDRRRRGGGETRNMSTGPMYNTYSLSKQESCP